MRSHIEDEPYQPDRGDCGPLVTLPPRNAEYECVKCTARWQGKAGPTACKRCGHSYVRWLDH